MSYYALFVRDIKVRSGYLFPEQFTKALRTIKYVFDYNFSMLGRRGCVFNDHWIKYAGLELVSIHHWLNIKMRECVVRKMF